MGLLPFRFPQISRLFSATLLFLALWGGFGLLLAVNAQNRQAHPIPFTQQQKEPKDVLGATASESAERADQFDYWKKITEEKPDYRDAFVEAAALAYQLGNTEEAKRLIDHAYTLDPASLTVQELKMIIEER